MALKLVEFEVFGKVQHVFMRKHAKIQAKDNNLTGTIRNTSKGTVVGVVCGRTRDVKKFQEWLKKVQATLSGSRVCSVWIAVA